MKPIRADDIAAFLGQPLQSRRPAAEAAQRLLRGPAPSGSAEPDQLSFVGHTAKDPQALLQSCRAGLLLLDQSIAQRSWQPIATSSEPSSVHPIEQSPAQSVGQSPAQSIAQAPQTKSEQKDPRSTSSSAALTAIDALLARAPQVGSIVLCENARLDFMRVLTRFFAPPPPRGVHPTAVIDKTAQVADDVYIGPLCTVGAGAVIGPGCVLHAGVHVYAGVQIGRDVIIHSGSVLGADGFGYERSETGQLVKFPHLGSVVIEDGVEIGANTCIDRGSLGVTRVKQGARIDNLVHLAHNTQVGQHSAVIAQSMVGGSTRIGDGAWIAPSSCLRDRIQIGDRAVVGLQSLVTRDVPAGQTVFGSPARAHASQVRLLRALGTLADPPTDSE